MILYIFLSHDVDWRKQGPEKEHIFARKDRFENSVFKRVNKENLYYNFVEIMDLEEKFGVRSTFFFRTYYENGNYLWKVLNRIAYGWQFHQEFKLDSKRENKIRNSY